MEVLKALTALPKAEEVHRDNAVFKLHYRFTVLLLMVFAVLVTTKQYFGEPIECDMSGAAKDGLSEKVVKSFCWMYGTYTLGANINDPKTPGLGNEAGLGKTWHAYYQWISIVLLLQAFFFYVPFYLWSVWEGGKMQKLVADLDGPLVPNLWDENTKQKMVDYLVGFEYIHSLYAYRYFLCELLNFVNVICQLFFINWLFNGKYSWYGTSVLNSNGVNVHPFLSLFPKTAKCKYHKYGPSGSLESRDFLCILPLNILNEKLFLILWFWLVFLVIVSFLTIIYRFLLVVSPKLRAYILLAQVRRFEIQQMQTVVDSIHYGGFFLLSMIGKNVSPFVFKELVSGLYESVKANEHIKKARKNNVIVV